MGLPAVRADLRHLPASLPAEGFSELIPQAEGKIETASQKARLRRRTSPFVIPPYCSYEPFLKIRAPFFWSFYEAVNLTFG